MLKFGNGLGFSVEARDARRVLHHGRRQGLDRNIPVQPLVVGAVHDTHPALADLLNDPVVA